LGIRQETLLSHYLTQAVSSASPCTRRSVASLLFFDIDGRIADEVIPENQGTRDAGSE
jgi:hypothetical protein